MPPLNNFGPGGAKDSSSIALHVSVSGNGEISSGAHVAGRQADMECKSQLKKASKVNIFKSVCRIAKSEISNSLSFVKP